MNEPEISPVAEMMLEMFIDLRRYFQGWHTFDPAALCSVCHAGRSAYLTENSSEFFGESIRHPRLIIMDRIFVHDDNGFNVALSVKKMLDEHTCSDLSEEKRVELLKKLIDRFVTHRTYLLQEIVEQILLHKTIPESTKVLEPFTRPKPVFTLDHKNFWVKFILVLVERLASGHQFNKTKRCSICDKGIVAYREFADKEFPKMTETKRVATELMATATSNAEAIRRILVKFVCSARGERAVHDLLVNAFHITLDSNDGYIKPRIVLSTALFGDAESGVIHDHFVKKHKG